MSDDYNAVRTVEQYAIAIGVISFLFPASVVFILLYKYNKLVSGRSLVHYVLVIAISDSIASLCIALGYPNPGSSTCYAQSFLLFFFSRSSWLFTDILILQLFYLMVFKKYFLNIKCMHAFVWPINIVLQVLPYSTGSIYGQWDDGMFANRARCYIVNNKNVDDFVWSDLWVTYTADAVLILSLCFIGVFALFIVLYSYRMSKLDKSGEYLVPKVRKTWKTMILYPIGLVVAWVPSLSYDYYATHYYRKTDRWPSHDLLIADYLEASNAVYGIVLAITFYVKTTSARLEWKKLLYCGKDNDNDDNYDDDNDNNDDENNNTDNRNTKSHRNPLQIDSNNISSDVELISIPSIRRIDHGDISHHNYGHHEV